MKHPPQIDMLYVGHPLHLHYTGKYSLWSTLRKSLRWHIFSMVETQDKSCVNFIYYKCDFSKSYWLVLKCYMKFAIRKIIWLYEARWSWIPCLPTESDIFSFHHHLCPSHIDDLSDVLWEFIKSVQAPKTKSMYGKSNIPQITPGVIMLGP